MTVTTDKPKQHDTFYYRVRRKDGSIQTGDALYPSREGLIRKLMADPLNESILDVSLPGGNKVGNKSRPKPRSLVIFSRELEVCLENGIPDRESIDMIRNGGDIEDPVLEYGLTEVSKAIAGGTNMPDAMAQHPYIFPALMVETLRAGNEGGFVPDAAGEVANDIEEEADQKAKVQKALMYPGIVLAISTAIFIVLMVWVVPAFGKLYDDLSGGAAELPALTRAVIGFSNQMSWMIPSVSVLGITAFMLYRRNAREEWMRGIVDPLKLKVPVFGNLFKLIALNRFCRVLASLTDHGIHPSDSLKIVSTAVGNLVFERSILRAKEQYDGGRAIDEALGEDPIFPTMLISFLGIGERTGGTAKSLRSLGRLYHRDIEVTTSKMEALIQPFFMVGIAFMVLIVALAIYLPYFSLGDIVSPY